MKNFYRDTLFCMLLAAPFFIYRLLSAENADISLRLVVSVLIIAPVAEEIIFRGFLQELASKKLPPATVILLISAVFAISHYVLSKDSHSLLVFFPSLALSAHYVLHRSLPAVIFIHFFYNISVFL